MLHLDPGIRRPHPASRRKQPTVGLPLPPSKRCDVLQRLFSKILPWSKLLPPCASEMEDFNRATLDGSWLPGGSVRLGSWVWSLTFTKHRDCIFIPPFSHISARHDLAGQACHLLLPATPVRGLAAQRGSSKRGNSCGTAGQRDALLPAI